MKRTPASLRVFTIFYNAAYLFFLMILFFYSVYRNTENSKLNELLSKEGLFVHSAYTPVLLIIGSAAGIASALTFLFYVFRGIKTSPLHSYLFLSVAFKTLYDIMMTLYGIEYSGSKEAAYLFLVLSGAVGLAADALTLYGIFTAFRQFAPIKSALIIMNLACGLFSGIFAISYLSSDRGTGLNFGVMIFLYLGFFLMSKYIAYAILWSKFKKPVKIADNKGSDNKQEEENAQ